MLDKQVTEEKRRWLLSRLEKKFFAKKNFSCQIFKNYFFLNLVLYLEMFRMVMRIRSHFVFDFNQKTTHIVLPIYLTFLSKISFYFQSKNIVKNFTKTKHAENKRQKWDEKSISFVKYLLANIFFALFGVIFCVTLAPPTVRFFCI